MSTLDATQGPGGRKRGRDGDCGPSFARVAIHIAMTVDLLAGIRDGQRGSCQLA